MQMIIPTGIFAAKKKILITGATSGLGLEVAKTLVELGHHVLLHGRTESKLRDVATSLMKSTTTTPKSDTTTTSAAATATATEPAVVETFRADLSQLAEVKAMAEQILSKHSYLDVLINNAGVFKPHADDGGIRTVDRLDVRFAVNTIAPYLLTKRLLPCLKAAAAASADNNNNNNSTSTGPTQRAAIVINVTTAIQKIVDEVALRGRREASMGDMDAYAQSKLALIMWNNAMAEKHANDNICFLSLNPGSMLHTNMFKRGCFGGTMPEGNPVSIGRDIVVKAALTFGMADTGKYFDNDREMFGTPYYDASDMVKCQQIVRHMEAIFQNTGIHVDDELEFR